MGATPADLSRPGPDVARVLVLAGFPVACPLVVVPAGVAVLLIPAGQVVAEDLNIDSVLDSWLHRDASFVVLRCAAVSSRRVYHLGHHGRWNMKTAIICEMVDEAQRMAQ